MKYVSKEIFDFLVYDPKEELKKRGLYICGEPADKVDIQTAFTCGVRFVLDLVDKAKPADVAPVVHAHWVNHKNNYVPIDASGDVSRSAFCSNCREWLTASDEYACRGNYCPNCGAKMDGVV